MTIKSRSITVAGIEVEIVRKAIKNLHIGVYPPNGRVRVATPKALHDEAVRLAIVTRLPWIKKQKSSFQQQERQSQRNYVSGETHFVFGKRYRMQLIEQDSPPKVAKKNSKALALQVRPDTDREGREKIMQSWYRNELRLAAAPLIAKWSELIGVPSPQFGIKRMKTMWGSCSSQSARIWLNLELAKKPPRCLEYVIVHELSHFIERHHNEQFVRLLNRHIPDWRTIRDELNSAPLKHEDWH